MSLLKVDTISAYNSEQITISDNQVINGTLNVSQGITGSLLGTASYALYATSASYEVQYELSSSYADTAISSSHSLNSDNSISASYAVSSSHSITSNTTISSSYSEAADTAISSSHSVNADVAISSSYSEISDTSISASNAHTASSVYSATGVKIVDGVNSNITSNIISANYLDLAAPAGAQGENGALDITNGAGYEIVFKGNNTTNILHAGTGSIYIGNSANPTLLQLLNNNLILNNATMLGTASWADDAVTASYADLAATASYSVNLVVSESITVAGIGIGRGAGQNANNIAFGDGALQFNTTGQGNVAIGFQTLDANISGNYNVGIGLSSLGDNNDGGFNVGVGVNSLTNNTTGNSNTGIGYGAGQNLATGSGNIFIGNSAGPTSLTNFSNRLYINNAASTTPLIYGEFDNDNVVINGNLSVTGTDTTVVLPNHASDPATPASGALYFNTSDSNFYGWNGAAWVQLNN